MENLKKDNKIKESVLNDYKELLNQVKLRFPETAKYIDDEILEIEVKYIDLDQVKYVFLFGVFLSYEMYFFLLQYIVKQPQNLLSV